MGVALSPAQVTERLGLHRMKDRSWFVHPRYVSRGSPIVKDGAVLIRSRSCATTGEGLFEGLQWLSQNIKGSR